MSRRASSAAVLVEQRASVNNRRVSSVGLMVETMPYVYQELLPTGIASEEASGTQVLSPGSVTLLLSGIAGAEAFGTTLFSAGSVSLLPGGIASAEAFGEPSFGSRKGFMKWQMTSIW